MSPLSLDNPIFTDYAFYAAILAVKMLVMAPITAYYRMTRKAFTNPEDSKTMGVAPKSNADVERVRRAHQNDLENIPVFWIVGLLYTLTNPTASTARLVFRIVAGSRIAHTFLYLSGSSLRPISFLLGVAANFFMLYKIITNFY